MGSITYEILTAKLTGRQQEHDPLVEKSKANTLFFLEVVYIFLELILVCVALRHKCNHSIQAKGNKFKSVERLKRFNDSLRNLPLALKLLDVLEVGSQGNI